jgi:TonB family protein
MKLVLFFSLSLILHVVAFLVPVSLNERPTDRAITVTILPLESVTEPSGGGAGAGHVGGTRDTSTKPVKAISIRQTGDSAPGSIPVAPEKFLVDAPSFVADNRVASIAGDLNNRGELAAGTNGGTTSGTGRSGTGSGHGSGNGEGSGPGRAGVPLTQASYRETPRPHYPDSARRDGKEGRVLLRVLIDEEGRTKAVEVNASSGHDLLDQAATEAIKKWRFVPARAGGKPVETWVKVPIDFQLSNAKP